MRKTNWNTYAIGGYSRDVANHQASAGGVHLYQVRKTKNGWQRRICQSNGCHQAYSPIEDIDDETGETSYVNCKK